MLSANKYFSPDKYNNTDIHFAQYYIFSEYHTDTQFSQPFVTYKSQLSYWFYMVVNIATNHKTVYSIDFSEIIINIEEFFSIMNYSYFEYLLNRKCSFNVFFELSLR